MRADDRVAAELYVDPVVVAESGEELRVLCGDRVAAGLRMREFQVAAAEALGRGDGGIILLEAPTGAGKTLTLLLSPWRGAVGVYPNKELLRDQADNLARTLLRLGFRPLPGGAPEPYDKFTRVLGLPGGCRLVSPFNSYSRVILAEISSETVEKTMGSRFKTIYGFAEWLVKHVYEDAYYIIFSTPDTWLSIMAASYRSYEDLGKTIQAIYLSETLEEAEDRVRRLGVARRDLLGKLFSVAFSLTKLLFVDEFHVYGEYEYAMLEPVLWAATLYGLGATRIVLSSATPDKGLAERLAGSLNRELRVIGAAGTGAGAVARGAARILFWDAGGPSWPDDAASAVSAGWRFIWRGLDSDLFYEGFVQAVSRGHRVLAVFDKVSQAVEFARWAGGAVCKTSIVDPRVCVGDEEYPVIAGSAAVTQGVDYPDISFGVVSRYAPVHVLQALGRFARRLPEATVIVPLHHAAAERAGEHGGRTDYLGLRRVLAEIYGYWGDPLSEPVPRDILEARRRLIRALVTIHYARATGHRHVLRGHEMPPRIRVVGPPEAYAGLVRFRRTGFRVAYRVAGAPGHGGEADIGVLLRNYEVADVDPDGTLVIDVSRPRRGRRGAQVSIHWPSSPNARPGTIYSAAALAADGASLHVLGYNIPLPPSAHNTLLYTAPTRRTAIILGHALPDTLTMTSRRPLMYLFI